MRRASWRADRIEQKPQVVFQLKMLEELEHFQSSVSMQAPRRQAQKLLLQERRRERIGSIALCNLDSGLQDAAVEQVKANPCRVVVARSIRGAQRKEPDFCRQRAHCLIQETRRRKPFPTSRVSEHAHGDCKRCAELGRPDIAGFGIIERGTADDLGSEDLDLPDVMTGPVNSPEDERFNSSFDAALNDPAAAERLEADVSYFVANIGTDFQPRQVDAGGARHPPETRVSFENVERSLKSGTSKKRCVDTTHCRGRKLFFAIVGVVP